MVAAHPATVVTGKGSDVQDSEQPSILQSIFCGSKTSFRICLQSPAVSTHRRNCLKFNLNAKQQNKRYLCLPFTVLLPQQSHSSGPSSSGLSRPVHCFTDHPDHSIASDWLFDAFDLYLIRMDYPSALVTSFLQPIFPPAIFSD